MTELKKWITTALLTLLLLPAMAQQKADTTYTFRFVPQKDMFYVPWNGNDMELNGEKENLAIAKIRSNRVKSELIIRAEIKEENFITRNHATEGDFVTVRLTMPVKETAATDAEAEARRKAEAERLEAEKRAEQRQRKPLNKTHLPTCRRKPKSQMIVISPCVPTCCAGPP